jgi:hypothetical protein
MFVEAVEQDNWLPGKGDVGSVAISKYFLFRIAKLLLIIKWGYHVRNVPSYVFKVTFCHLNS